MFKTTKEPNSTLYFLSPLNEYLLTIDNLEAYLGWRYNNQSEKENCFRFYF